MMNRKTSIVVCLALFVAVSLFAPAVGRAASPASAPASKQPIVLKALSCFPKTAISVRTMGLIVERVKARSKGELTINWVGGPEAMSPFDQPRALMDGTIDFLITPFGYYERSLPPVYVADLSKYTPMKEREVGIYDFWVKMHEPSNIRYLGLADASEKFFVFTNYPIKNPKEDFKGRKFRAGPPYTEFMAALGCVGITIPNSDIYSAVSEKMVDGVAHVPSMFDAMGLHEVIKYWIEPGFWRVSTSHLMNLKRFNSLPKNLQDLLLSIAKEVEAEDYAFMGANQTKLFQKFKEKGMQPITLSPENAKWYYDLAYEAKWNEGKKKMTPEDYAKVREALLK